MASNVQSGQPSVENDKSGVYFVKSNEVIATAIPAAPAVFIKSLRVQYCFIKGFYEL
jgi:hypothetical protein